MNTAARYVLVLAILYIWTVPLAAQDSDSLAKIYEIRKQRSIERFGPRCEVNWNGLPTYCDDIEFLNQEIAAESDIEKAWQFFEVNKGFFEIEDVHESLRLYERKGSYFNFIQFYKNIPVHNAFTITISGDGEIIRLAGEYYPEAKQVDLKRCIGWEKACNIVLSDKSIVKNPENTSIIDSEYQYIACDKGGCNSFYRVIVSDDSLYTIFLDAHTGEIVHRWSNEIMQHKSNIIER